MRTTITIAFAMMTALVAACAGESVPEQELRFFVDDEEVAFEDLSEPVQEIVYETIESEPELRPDGTKFRATCSADCGSSTITVKADKCQCEDNVGCAGQNKGGKIAVSPCPEAVE